MKTIHEEQEDIIREFETFTEWLDRYEYLIELSGNLQPLPAQYKTPEYLIAGCQSRVWLMAEMHNGLVVYRAETDAIITKGIIALLIRVLSERTPDEILQTELCFIERIGLQQNLSPTRSNGLLSMIKQMKLYALAFSVQNRQQN